VGMASLQYVLEEGNRDGWDSVPIMVLIALASVCLITFVVHELETPYPVVDLRVFKNASYAAGTGINFLLGLVLFAGNFLFALYCGTVMHYVALDIGKIFLVAGLIQIVIMPIIGKLVTRVDPRRMLVFGILGTSLSLWLNAHLTDQAGFWDLTRPQFVRSVSMGFIFIPISMLALSDLPNEIRGNATGLFNLTRELGGSIGTAWMGLLVDRGCKIHASYLREAINPENPLVQERIAALRNSIGQQTFTSELVPEAILEFKVRVQALILSFNEGFARVTLLFLVCLILVLFLKRPKPGGAGAAGAH
jgi:DHA2 family multidrug resistance protein